MLDRTGYRTPQRVIPLGHSFRTNAPVGIHEHLDPTNPCSYHGNNNMSKLSKRRWLIRWNAYKLYPIVEMVTGVPLGMANSVYTLPEVPTIGFVRGRTSSSLGVRSTSTATGLILKDSYPWTESNLPSDRDANKRPQRTFVTATRYGMLSKSLAVRSASPLALAFARDSLISARSFS